MFMGILKLNNRDTWIFKRSVKQFYRVLRNIARHQFYHATDTTRQVKCNAIYTYISRQRTAMKIMLVFPIRPVFRKEYTRPNRILEFSMFWVYGRGWVTMEEHSASRCNDLRDSSQNAARCRFGMYALLHIK